MRYSRICVLALAALIGTPAAGPAQTPPAAVPDVQPGPQPVQPAPPLPGPVTPQPAQPAPSLPAPAEPQPVKPPPTLPPPTLPPPGEALPAPPAQQRTSVPDPDATLAGKRGDASDIDEVALVAKPVLLLSGQARWDEGFQRLSESFETLRAEAKKAGLPVAGRPLSLFVETTDDGFRFDAMLPVAVPAGGPPPGFGAGVRLGESPAGKALRFLHVAPYDDIDSTYETITAYLDAKSIAVKDAFLEEYVSDLKDPGDPNLEINVYVQPK